MELLRLALAVVDLVREYLVEPRVLEVHHYHHAAVDEPAELAGAEPEPVDAADPDLPVDAYHVIPAEGLRCLLMRAGAAVRDGASIDGAADELLIDLELEWAEAQVAGSDDA